MTAPIDARRPGACLVATGLLIAAAACGPERPDLPPETAPTHVDGDPPELPDDNAASGEVTVVTMEADANGAQRYLDHRYGDAPRTPIQLAGVAMLRIETEPHVAIAWTGPTFAVTFQRGQARSEQWLEDLARETVRAVTGR